MLGLFGSRLWALPTRPPCSVGPEPSVAPTSSQAVLLLTNGSLREGKISEDSTDYFVHTKSGTLTYPKRLVETRGNSVREIYQYLVERLPARDPDEHMKLGALVLEPEDEARGHGSVEGGRETESLRIRKR